MRKYRRVGWGSGGSGAGGPADMSRGLAAARPRSGVLELRDRAADASADLAASLTVLPPRPAIFSPLMPPRPAATRTLPAIPVMLLVTLIWGGNFTVSKFALTQLPVLPFSAIRFMLASVCLWGIVRLVEPVARTPRPVLWKLVGLGIVGNTIYQIAFMTGLTMTTATNSSLLVASTPMAVIVLGRLLGVEHPDPRDVGRRAARHRGRRPGGAQQGRWGRVRRSDDPRRPAHLCRRALLGSVHHRGPRPADGHLTAPPDGDHRHRRRARAGAPRGSRTASHCLGRAPVGALGRRGICLHALRGDGLHSLERDGPAGGQLANGAAGDDGPALGGPHRLGGPRRTSHHPAGHGCGLHHRERPGEPAWAEGAGPGRGRTKPLPDPPIPRRRPSRVSWCLEVPHASRRLRRILSRYPARPTPDSPACNGANRCRHRNPLLRGLPLRHPHRAQRVGPRHLSLCSGTRDHRTGDCVGADVAHFTVGQLVGVGCLVDSCRTCDACARIIWSSTAPGASPVPTTPRTRSSAV